MPIEQPPRTLLLTLPAVSVAPGQTRGPSSRQIPVGVNEVLIELDAAAWAAGQEVRCQIDISTDGGNAWRVYALPTYRKNEMAPFEDKGTIGVQFATPTINNQTFARGTITNLVGPTFTLAAAMYSRP